MKPDPSTAHAWLDTARRLLDKGGGLESGFERFETNLSAQLLLAHVLGHPRPWLIAHPDAVLSDTQREQADQMLARLRAGEPLPYLLGHWEFFGLDFEVTSAVLIPRPETELLVEQAVAWLKAHPGRRSAADVGTGSGCIAVSIAKTVPEARLLAVDRSPEALAVARRNAERNSAANQIRFLQNNLLDGITGPFDLVCANLPYIPSTALTSLEVARYEPHLALDGGVDGLDAIRALLADSPRWLAPGGCILLEIQFDQGAVVAELARQYLQGANAEVLVDLEGHDRVVAISQSGSVENGYPF